MSDHPRPAERLAGQLRDLIEHQTQLDAAHPGDWLEALAAILLAYLSLVEAMPKPAPPTIEDLTDDASDVAITLMGAADVLAERRPGESARDTVDRFMTEHGVTDSAYSLAMRRRLDQEPGQ